MQFRVLGCSGSELDRSHPCSFMVGTDTLLDMGSGASRLTLQEQLGIKQIFLSHAHLDHVKDLAFFVENIFSKRTDTVKLYAAQDTLTKIRTHLFNNAIWPDFTQLPSPKNPVIEFCAFEPLKSMSLGDVSISSVPVNHPGGCVAFFMTTAHGTVIYSGDTGPTDLLWNEINNLGPKPISLLLECSFPNRLETLAHESGHLTPQLFKQELSKLKMKNIQIHAYHLKAPYRDEILSELQNLHDPRISVLEPGIRITF